MPGIRPVPKQGGAADISAINAAPWRCISGEWIPSLESRINWMSRGDIRGCARSVAENPRKYFVVNDGQSLAVKAFCQHAHYAHGIFFVFSHLPKCATVLCGVVCYSYPHNISSS